MAVGDYSPSPLIFVVGLAGAGALVIPHPTSGTDGEIVATGTKTSTQPVDEIPQTRTGVDAPGYGFLSWFNRIHYSENPISLGSVASSQTRVLRVFNSYFVPRTLASVVGANDAGITLTRPAPEPIAFAAQQERAFSFAVSTEGPPSVAATYTFTFDVGTTVVAVNGTRIVTWYWEPDWSSPIVERMEWKTDVQRAYDGTEQRIGLRNAPRTTYEFAFMATGRDRQKLEAALYGWGARVWALPIWPDGEELVADLASGSVSVPASTETRSYAAGGLLVLLSADGSAFEVLEVASVAPAAVTLDGSTGRTWPAGTRVFPARVARLEDRQGVSRFTPSCAYGTAVFTLEDQISHAEATETIFRGYPVITERPDTGNDPALDYERKLAVLEPVIGRRVIDDESGVPDMLQSYRWVLTSRAEIDAFRSFLYARKGKLRGVWVPTWADDVTVAKTILASDTSIDIQAIDYVQQIDVGPHRRNLRIELTDGSVFYRQINSASVVDANTERLLIPTSFGRQILPEEILQVSFMALCRLDSDTAEIAWATGSLAESALNFRAPNTNVV